MEDEMSNSSCVDEVHMINLATEARSQAIAKRSNLPVGSCVFARRPGRKKAGDISPGTGGEESRYFTAGNIETLWQTSSHAEKNAIIIAANAGFKDVVAVCIAAERQLFTPCGGCMDHIFEFGGKDCVVIHYNPATKAIKWFTATQLMPYYPTRT